MKHTDYTLFISLRSPFARRARVTLDRLGIGHEIKLVDVFSEQALLSSYNPLGSIPILMTPKHGLITDSQNILEYLHEITGAIWPASVNDRIQQRQVSVWCLGIIHHTVLYFQEKNMHEVPSPRWLTDHISAIEDTLATLNSLNQSVWLLDGELTQPAWDLCVGLQYLSIRTPLVQWEDKYPAFKNLLTRALEKEFFRESTPKI